MGDKILFVDDEIQVLKSLKRLLMDEPYEVLASDSPATALKMLEQNEVAVVVSDQRMAEMQGTLFLEKVKGLCPDTVRMILTGYADFDAAMAAINRGNVYRFIAKPWDDAELKLALKNAVSHFKLLSENKRLHELTKRQNGELRDLNMNLEKKIEERTTQVKLLYKKLRGSFHELIRVFVDLMELFNPWLGGHVKRVASVAKEIAAQQGLEENSIQLVEASALLHNIGLIGLPRNMLEKKDEELNELELALIKQHPVIGHTMLNRIEDLKQVSVIVRSVHENFDGTGYPDGLKNEIIPEEARIVRVANDYDTFVNKMDLPKSKALERLQLRSGYEYDPFVVMKLLEVLRHFQPERDKHMTLPLRGLAAGMVLARGIKTKSGRLLMSEGTKIQEAHLEKLANLTRIDPVVDLVYVLKPTS